MLTDRASLRLWNTGNIANLFLPLFVNLANSTYVYVTNLPGTFTIIFLLFICNKAFEQRNRLTYITISILGITNFDLLGDFGSIEWLGNFKIVLLYNLSFATASTLCIANKFTAKVRRELYARLVENYMFLANCVSFVN